MPDINYDEMNTKQLVEASKGSNDPLVLAMRAKIDSLYFALDFAVSTAESSARIARMGLKHNT